ncbi:MAG TPA: hypothetical protein VKB58_03680 [Terriglobales bacterium]|nr:hypothetical protein [Terriglobales bacterium]
MLALIVAVLVVYAPVKTYPFIVLDDLVYIVWNSHLHELNWDTVRWSFTAFHAANWQPLSWLSHALDYHFFLLDAGRHHETNMLLHAVNAVLLFWVLSRATGYLGRSCVVAGLFALHPINVESVAWVAERKNLLSMFFFLLALGAYGWYARRPQLPRYLVVAALFALGLMSKAQIITLPLVLLLWDYWPLGRMFPPSEQHSSSAAAAESASHRTFAWLVAEKLPLMALSAGSAILTVKAQIAADTMIGTVNRFSFASRLGNALIAYARYLGKAIWPTHLAFFYPHTRSSPPAWQVAGASVLLVITTALVLINRQRRYLVMGWFWFLGTLIPMIGLVQVGSQAMADRYAYLPFIGLFIAATWGLAEWTEPWPLAKIWLPVGSIAVLAFLSLATRRQLSYWSDDLTLWEHSSEVVKDNWMAENSIGEDLLRKGDREAAIPHFRAAAAMEPLALFPHYHIGIYEEEHQHPHEALQQLQEVMELTQPYATQTAAMRSNTLAYMSYAYNQLGDYANQQKCMTMAAQELRR